jgi:SAM-dependent methyltransferase
VKSKKTVSYREAFQALLSSFQERMVFGGLNPDTQDYFYGSLERWSMAIEELSGNPGRGPVLDIGAHEGFLCRALVKLGYSVFALDLLSPIDESVWRRLGVEWRQCHIEADPIPFQDGYFTGIYMGQLLEHFTYSPRKPFQEIRRVLKPGGLFVVDVPNAGEWHNYYRLIRGKNILWDYKKHYVDYEPSFYKGRPYFERHNHEFTPNELRSLAEACQFEVERIAYIRSRRYGKKGMRSFEIPFTALRDLIPNFRKSIMLTATKNKV